MFLRCQCTVPTVETNSCPSPPLKESAVSSTRHNEAVRENQTRLFFLLQRHSRPLKKKQPAQLSHIGPLADNNNIILATMLPTLAERNRCFAI
jgi:hypothetical protein